MDQLFDLIKDYGGYAGAASVLGLAVLSLLYFAQAREVRRLREWAGRAPERAAELEQRVAEAARRPAPAVQRQPAAQRQPGQPQTAAAQATAKPATANGQAGAPAPATAVGAGAAGAAAGGAAAAAAGQGPQATATGAPPAPGAPAGDEAEKTEKDEQAGDAKPAEGGAATAASGATQTPPATEAPQTGDGAPPTTPASDASAAGATPPPVPPRTAAARPRTPAPSPRPAAPLRSSTASGARTSRPATVQTQRTPRRRLPIVLAVIAAVVVLAGVALALTLGGGDDTDPTQTPNKPNQVVPPAGSEGTSTSGTANEARPRGETKVAVLNGTTIAGLAKRTGDDVKKAGYSVGTIADAPEQTRSATLVQYADGARREAQAVARIIGVGSDAVSPLDVNTRTVAGEDARVVVTVGADQNQQSGQG